MSAEDEGGLQDRLKAALWYTIGKLVDEESLDLNITANQPFIAALTEMVWTQLENTARDLECFARHANRTTITTDDVLLLVRRNEELEGILREFVEREKENRQLQVQASVAAGGKGKRKR